MDLRLRQRLAFGIQYSSKVGESGGAIPVEPAMAAPQLSGLFSHAIIESAIGNGPVHTLAQSETSNSAAIIAAVGCANAADVAACLRAVPANDDLLNPNPLAPGSAVEVIDGLVIPRQTLDAFRSGKCSHVPVIIGITHDEYTFAVWPLEKPPFAPVTGKDVPLSSTVIGYWSNMARTGNPNAPTSAATSPLQLLEHGAPACRALGQARPGLYPGPARGRPPWTGFT